PKSWCAACTAPAAATWPRCASPSKHHRLVPPLLLLQRAWAFQDRFFLSGERGGARLPRRHEAGGPATQRGNRLTTAGAAPAASASPRLSPCPPMPGKAVFRTTLPVMNIIFKTLITFIWKIFKRYE